MKNKYLILSLFVIGILMSSSLVSAGWFDWLFRDKNVVGEAYAGISPSACNYYKQKCEDTNYKYHQRYCDIWDKYCKPTCDDGIKNGNEEGIDCGGDCKPCSNVVSPKFEELWVDKVYPLSQNYISFTTDALVQYSADGNKKNTYGYDENGGRITASGDLTLDPSKYVITKSKALVHYSSDGNNKHTVEFQSDGTRFTTNNDLIFDPARYVVAKTDAIVQYSGDGNNKNTYGFDDQGGRITANGNLNLDPSQYVVVNSDAIVQYSADGQNKNTYGYDNNGGRITANGDLTLDPSKYVITKSKALVHYSSDENIKHTVEFEDGSREFSMGTRLTTAGDLTLDPAGNVIVNGDLVLLSPDGSKWKIEVSNSGELSTEKIQ